MGQCPPDVRGDGERSDRTADRDGAGRLCETNPPAQQTGERAERRSLTLQKGLGCEHEPRGAGEARDLGDVRLLRGATTARAREERRDGAPAHAGIARTPRAGPGCESRGRGDRVERATLGRSAVVADQGAADAAVGRGEVAAGAESQDGRSIEGHGAAPVLARLQRPPSGPPEPDRGHADAPRPPVLRTGDRSSRP